MVANYLTQDDVNNFGGELIDVVQRGARQAIAPVVDRLEQENQELRDRVARETKRNLDHALERVVPNWQEINRDPRWFQWLAAPDTLSGYSRQELLNDAVASGDAQRVINFFRGFQAAAGQPGQLGQAAGPRSAAQPNGPVYTRPQILEMARRRQRGLIDDAAWRRWEYELCRASKEGRVRGALSLETGLPTTL